MFKYSMAHVSSRFWSVFVGNILGYSRVSARGKKFLLNFGVIKLLCVMCVTFSFDMSESAPFFAKYMNPTGAAPEPTAEQPPRLDFKYLKSTLADVEVDRYWESALITWFVYLRIDVVQNCCGDEISTASLVRSIESGEFPRLDHFGQFESMTEVLAYFARSEQEVFKKCELSWLFAVLLLVDRLPNGEIVSLLESVLRRVDNQLRQSDPADELYGFLVVCHSILSRFFHRL